MEQELQGFLFEIQSDFEKIGGLIEMVTQEVLENKISRYPVFIASKQPVQLGVQLISKSQMGTYWEYKASHLEELVKKGLMESDRLMDFKQAHNNPLQKACVLIIEPGGANFVFVPFLYAKE